MPIERMPLYQDGTATVHDVLKIATNGLLSKAGGVSGDVNGRGMNPYSITTGNLPGSASNVPGLGLGLNSDRTDKPYSALSFGHDSDHNGLIALDTYNGMVSKAVKIRLNGVFYDFPGAGNGNVLGPNPDPTGDNIPLWNGGHNLKDGGSSTGRIGALALAGATSGAVTLAAPAVAGTNTITFPAATITLADLSQGDVSATIPYAVLPVYARFLMAKTYDASFNSNFNLFQMASFAKGQTTAAVVAQFGQGESALSGNTSWGGNHAGIASVSGAVAIAEELNPVVVASGGSAYGLVIAAAGYFPSTVAIQIQTNEAVATFGTGINFNNAVHNAVTGALIQSDSSTVAQNALNFAGTYSVGEIATPSFGVGATPANINSKLLVTASASGNPSISVAATGGVPATNANLILNPLGTGELQVNGSVRVLGGKILTVTGPITAEVGTTATHALNFLGSYTVGEINTPSFGVGITPGSINSKVLITGSASGNPSIAAAAAGSVPATNANLILNALGTGEVQVNGIFSTNTAMRAAPVGAPASPAAGWYIFTDSGDGNKLKAKASTGTVVTLGTP